MHQAVKTAIACAAAAGLAAAATSAAFAERSYNTSPAGVAKRARTQASGVSGFAVVRYSDGKIARGLNAVSTTPDGVGSWIVTFNSDISKCAYTGNVGLQGDSGVSEPGFLTVAGASGDPNSVYVQTFNQGGILTKMGFHLVVTC